MIGYWSHTVYTFINDLSENANSLVMTFADNTANDNEESQLIE